MKSLTLELHKHAIPEQSDSKSKKIRQGGEKYQVAITIGSVVFLTSWFFGDKENQNKILSETLNSLRNAEVVIRKG